MLCHHCKNPVLIDSVVKIGFNQECPHCTSYLHCCLNCRFYDVSKANNCFEPQAELVTDKERANYCEYFTPPSEHEEKQELKNKDKAINQFNALFGD